MLAAVPIIAFVLIWIFLRRALPQSGGRGAFLFAAVTWGFLVFLGTEGLSLFHLIQRGPLTTFWSFMAIVFGLMFFFSRRSFPASQKTRFSLSRSIRDLTGLERAILISGVLIVTLVGVTAWMGAPNNWDSLTYHMSRVAHWAQNHTVDHYPTAIKRQIYFSPWAEFGILQFQVLAGNDRLANFIQWFAMVGCAVGVSAIASLLGLPRIWQIMTAFLSLTIPMGILQGATTQTDYVAALWSVCFVYFSLFWQRFPGPRSVIALGLSAGLAFLTKTTTALFVFPFSLWLLGQAWKKFNLKIFKVILISGMIALGINAPHFARNIAVSGNVFGEPDYFRNTQAEGMTPGFFFSNVIRNAGLHLGTSIKPLNQAIEKGIYQLHEALKISIADPRNTFGGHPFQIGISLQEDTAGNFCHLTLIMIAYILFFLFWKKWHPSILAYGLCVLGAGALFSGLLKWQPFGSRLHLPIFVLAVPLVSAVLSEFKRYQKAVIVVIGVVLFVTAMPYVLRNSGRRLYSKKKATVFNAPRIQQYFANDITYFKPYKEAVEYVTGAGCQQVGLALGEDTWEYPLWALFRHLGETGVRLEHVNVPPPVPDYPSGPFHACAVISVGASGDPEMIRTENGHFVKKWETLPVKVYLPRQQSRLP